MGITRRIMGVQMQVSDELADNLPVILEHIALAGQLEADVVLFPEMSLTGYHGRFDQTARTEALAEISRACAQHGVAAIVSAGNKQPEGIYIQMDAYGRDGRWRGAHAKMVPTSGDRKWCIPGQSLRTYTCDGLTIGMLICNDLWVTPGCGPYPDPRLAYQLGQRGAQLVFHAINSGHKPEYTPYHESNLALRARESGFPICTANAVQDPSQPVNAASGIMRPDGIWQVKAPRVGAGYYIGDVALS